MKSYFLFSIIKRVKMRIENGVLLLLSWELRVIFCSLFVKTEIRILFSLSWELKIGLACFSSIFNSWLSKHSIKYFLRLTQELKHLDTQMIIRDIHMDFQIAKLLKRGNPCEVHFLFAKVPKCQKNRACK